MKYLRSSQSDSSQISLSAKQTRRKVSLNLNTQMLKYPIRVSFNGCIELRGREHTESDTSINQAGT